MIRTFRILAATLAIALAVSPVAVFAQDTSEITAEAPAVDSAPASDAELALAIGALAKAFATPDGKVSWIIAAPALVFVLVFFARKKGGELVPFLRTKAGGVILATLSAVLLAVLEHSMMTGGALSLSALLLIAFKTAYGLFFGMGIQSGQHNLRQHVAAKAAGQIAAAHVATKADALGEIDKS